MPNLTSRGLLLQVIKLRKEFHVASKDKGREQRKHYVQYLVGQPYQMNSRLGMHT